jgi:type IV pilus assembly protein PilO
MEREPIWLAAWRLNRFLPLMVVALILLNAAAYLSWSLVFLPRQSALEKELMGLQSRIRQARQSGLADRTPAEIYRRGEADLRLFRAAIPAKSEFPALLGDIFTLAGRAGLAIDQISYQPKEIEGQGLLRYGLAFSVHGDYGQVKRFIDSLEKSDRLLVIDGLTLSGGREEGTTKVELRLQLATFFRTEGS